VVSTLVDDIFLDTNVAGKGVFQVVSKVPLVFFQKLFEDAREEVR